MRRFAGYLLVFAAAMAIKTGDALSQDIRLYVPTDSVSVGEPFEIAVVARYRDHLQLQIPLAEGDQPAQLGDIVLTALMARDRRSAGAEVADSLVFRAAAFRLQNASTRGGSLAFRGRESTVEIAVPAVDVFVRPTVDPESEPRAISPIQPAPPPLWWILIPLAIILLLYFGIRTWRRRSVHPASRARPDLPPLEEALHALSALESAEVSREHDRAFVILLSDILRTYIGRRLGLPARESTTGELLGNLAGHPVITTAMIDASRPMMNTMDAVKFARKPLPCSRDDLKKRIRQWILEADRLAKGQEAESSEVAETPDP